MGTIYGLGLGPGDPDLMTVRAARLLAAAGHVAFFRKAGRPGRARTIVEGLLPPTAVELAMEYPVTTEIPVDDPRYNALLSGFYARWAGQLGALVEAGRDVVVLCEGDPFFYGSFMHLHARLKDRCRVEVVPGITAMSAAWTASGQPVTWGDDVLTVLPGTLDEERLTAGIAQADAVVVMKLGCHLDRVRRAFDRAGRGDDAWLVQCATLPEQRVVPLRAYERRSTPYFSIVVAHGRGRRP